jgi:hypothetical protein
MHPCLEGSESALVTFCLFSYLSRMITVEEIERAVEQLPPEDFVKLTAWMDQHRAESANHLADNSAKSSADWFNIYMACPDSFEIPPRNKQFYKPGE